MKTFGNKHFIPLTSAIFTTIYHMQLLINKLIIYCEKFYKNAMETQLDNIDLFATSTINVICFRI
jgi:hypothetical protein